MNQLSLFVTESNLKDTIRRLNETANMDVAEWISNRDWLGRNEKDLHSVEEALRNVWNLGRNIVLQWASGRHCIRLLVIPQYVIASTGHNESRGDSQADIIKNILAFPKQVDPHSLEMNATRLGFELVEVHVAAKTLRLYEEAIGEIVDRFGPHYVEHQAVALFDIVGFSLCSPLEQVAQLNSLSYSLNSAHARMLGKKSDISFTRSTTGDGFYVWNRDSSIQANINLYHYMHLALADNAVARTKSKGNVTPELRAAFHVGNHYEFYQSEGLSPVASSFIVGDVTIELARMVEYTKPGQVLVGDFEIPMNNAEIGEVEYVDTSRFIELTQGTLSSLEGLVLSGERIDAIRCYLTGEKMGERFNISRYTITDKHGISRDAYNAKINIYRENSDPIFLGLQDARA
jgi:hypothetical protein